MKIDNCKKCIVGHPQVQRSGFMWLVVCACGEKTGLCVSEIRAIQVWNKKQEKDIG